MKHIVAMFVIFLGFVGFLTVNSASTWDPCENVYKSYSSCFTSDKAVLNKVCAFGTNDKFLEGLKKASLTCRGKYDDLKKKNGDSIKVGDPCANTDTKFKSCFSSDRDSVKKACKAKSPEDIGKAYIDLSLTCRSALEK